MNKDGVRLSLAGQVALITGGSRGIGAATVKLFVAAGARVVFSYHKAEGAAEAMVRECGPESCAAIAVDLDGARPAQQLVRQAVTRFGRLDVLVVNHGIWPPEDVPIDRMSEDQWRRTLAVNLDAAFALVKHSVAQMKEQGSGGRIVLVSSTSGQRGEAYHCDYSASKGALISMTKSLSSELAPDGVYVNCVAPGWVATDMAAPALQNTESRNRILGTIPLGRVGTPDEIAAPILFLCTEHANFITGEIFNVNGGAVLVG